MPGVCARPCRRRCWPRKRLPRRRRGCEEGAPPSPWRAAREMARRGDRRCGWTSAASLRSAASELSPSYARAPETRRCRRRGTRRCRGLAERRARHSTPAVVAGAAAGRRARLVTLAIRLAATPWGGAQLARPWADRGVRGRRLGVAFDRRLLMRRLGLPAADARLAAGPRGVGGENDAVGVERVTCPAWASDAGDDGAGAGEARRWRRPGAKERVARHGRSGGDHRRQRQQRHRGRRRHTGGGASPRSDRRRRRWIVGEARDLDLVQGQADDRARALQERSRCSRW